MFNERTGRQSRDNGIVRCAFFLFKRNYSTRVWPLLDNRRGFASYPMKSDDWSLVVYHAKFLTAWLRIAQEMHGVMQSEDEARFLEADYRATPRRALSMSELRPGSTGGERMSSAQIREINYPRRRCIQSTAHCAGGLFHIIRAGTGTAS